TRLGPISIFANGAGTTGNGGAIFIEQYSSASLELGTAFNFPVQAHSAATGGNGGSIATITGGDLRIDGTAGGFGFAPQGTDGNGASFHFSAGNNTTANLEINGSLDASGVGKGNGGV